MSICKCLMLFSTILSFTLAAAREIGPKNTFALLVRGSTEIDHQANQALFYQTLIKKGLPSENIVVVNSPNSISLSDLKRENKSEMDNPFVTYIQDMLININQRFYDYDGDGRVDIDYELSKDNISFAMEELALRAQSVKGEKQFIFYFNSHGRADKEMASISIYTKDYKDSLSGQELRRMLELHFPEDQPQFLMIQACSSGSFRHHLKKKNRMLLTSAGDSNSSYMGTPTGDKGSYFTYNFLSAINRQDTQGNQINADRDLDGKVSVREAFEYAKEQFPLEVITIDVIPSTDMLEFQRLNLKTFSEIGKSGMLYDPREYFAQSIWLKRQGYFFLIMMGEDIRQLTIITQIGDTPNLYALSSVDFVLF